MNINKRTISLVLCCIMLFTAFPVTDINEIIPSIKASAAETNSGIVYFGDLNENGKIEASDARLILQAAALLRTLTDRQMQIADCNQDNKITAADARTTLRVAARLASPVIFETPEIISQGEYIQNLISELGLGGTTTSEQFFSNVTPEHEFYQAIQTAVEWGVLDPAEDFDPDKEATVDFTVSTAMNALANDNLPDDAKLVDDNTDVDDECNVDLAKEIIEQAKNYRINEEPEKEFESIKIKDDVKSFDASEITAESEDEYTFNSYGEEIPEVGDIFIAETPDGQFAEKIVAVTDNGDGTYTAETVQPEMDEVFDDFSFYDTATPAADEVTFIPAENVFYTVGAENFSLLTASRSKEKDDVLFSGTFDLNSSNDPNLSPELVLKTTSDYTNALNSEYVCQVPTAKDLLEQYNQLVEGPGEDNKNIKTEKVKKYESGWNISAALKISNFEIDFDFSDFWTTGNYEITLMTDILNSIEFAGNFNSEKYLGTLKLTHGIKSIFIGVSIDIYLYIDMQGDAKLVGSGKIEQTYGNYDGKTDTLNNNSFNPVIEANIDAKGGVKFDPQIKTLGFDLAEMSIQIGVEAETNMKARPLVKYNDELYYYAGDALSAPEGLAPVIFGCMDLSISYPIVKLSVSAGEDAKKQIEKIKKKNNAIPNIPLDHTFEICTLNKKESLLTPKTKHSHFEVNHKGFGSVEECTTEEYKTLAHLCSGYVVKKGTDDAIANATVQLLDKNNKLISTAKTNLNGEFDLKFIPFGEYSVKIISDGAEVTLDEKVKIDQNESDIGKLEFMIDYVKIYADYIKNLGKSRKIFQDLTDSKTTFYYCDSAICKLEKDADYPQLIVYYYDSDVYDSIYQHFPYNHFEVYSIENGKVVKKHQFQICTVYGSTQVDIWKDPKTLNQVLTCYKYTEGDKFNVVYPNEKLIYEYTWGMNAPYYATGYKNYIYSTDILTYVNAYSKYTLKNTTCDYIRIAVIDDNGKVETKTFSF